MNHEVEQLLPNALAAVRTYLLKDTEAEIAYKEYDGYAANLGAAIRQAGLLPALSFFTDVHKMKSGEQRPRRNVLLAAILFTLGEKNIPEDAAGRGRELLKKVIKAGYGETAFQTSTPLKIGAPENPEAIDKWRKDIVRASVALKLALRTFQHSKDEHPNAD